MGGTWEKSNQLSSVRHNPAVPVKPSPPPRMEPTQDNLRSGCWKPTSPTPPGTCGDRGSRCWSLLSPYSGISKYSQKEESLGEEEEEVSLEINI